MLRLETFLDVSLISKSGTQVANKNVVDNKWRILFYRSFLASTLSLYFFLQINKLLNIEIWRDAATQVFYSLGIGYGSIFMYSSYNKASFKCKTAALSYGVIDTTVGICSCIIVFSLQGFQAHIKHAECVEKLKTLNGSLVEGGDQLSCNASFLSQPVCKFFVLVTDYRIKCSFSSSECFCIFHT